MRHNSLSLCLAILLVVSAFCNQSQPVDLQFYASKFVKLFNVYFEDLSFGVSNTPFFTTLQITQAQIQSLNLTYVANDSNVTYPAKSVSGLAQLSGALDQFSLNITFKLEATFRFGSEFLMFNKFRFEIVQLQGQGLGMWKKLGEQYINRFVQKLYGKQIPISVGMPEFLIFGKSQDRNFIRLDVERYIEYQKSIQQVQTADEQQEQEEQEL